MNSNYNFQQTTFALMSTATVATGQRYSGVAYMPEAEAAGQAFWLCLGTDDEDEGVICFPTEKALQEHLSDEIAAARFSEPLNEQELRQLHRLLERAIANEQVMVPRTNSSDLALDSACRNGLTVQINTKAFAKYCNK